MSTERGLVDEDVWEYVCGCAEGIDRCVYVCTCLRRKDMLMWTFVKRNASSQQNAAAALVLQLIDPDRSQKITLLKSVLLDTSIS